MNGQVYRCGLFYARYNLYQMIYRQSLFQVVRSSSKFMFIIFSVQLVYFMHTYFKAVLLVLTFTNSATRNSKSTVNNYRSSRYISKECTTARLPICKTEVFTYVKVDLRHKEEIANSELPLPSFGVGLLSSMTNGIEINTLVKYLPLISRTIYIR